jgi:hypothetical protein
VDTAPPDEQPRRNDGDLSPSLLECTARDVDQHVIVPSQDRKLFAWLRELRTDL